MVDSKEPYFSSLILTCAAWSLLRGQPEICTGFVHRTWVSSSLGLSFLTLSAHFQEAELPRIVVRVQQGFCRPKELYYSLSSSWKPCNTGKSPWSFPAFEYWLSSRSVLHLVFFSMFKCGFASFPFSSLPPLFLLPFWLFFLLLSSAHLLILSICLSVSLPALCLSFLSSPSPLLLSFPLSSFFLFSCSRVYSFQQ